MEQFKCLEQQSESRIQLLQDLQEFFRRKAEIELEYSRSLEKLAERFSSKIRSSREHQQFKWVYFGIYVYIKAFSHLIPPFTQLHLISVCFF